MELDECAAIFRSLQNDFYEEYVMYDLSSLAVALVFPLVCSFFIAIWYFTEFCNILVLLLYTEML